MKNINYLKNNTKIPEIGIGVLGYGLMGKAHSNGFLQMPYVYWPPPAIPKLKYICGIPEKALIEEARRFGYSNYSTDWKDLINDSNIQIFINAAPNFLHAEPCIKAAKKGIHIVCEKPLARNAIEAKEMLKEVKKSKVKHICNFNYRTIPAISFAKQLVEDGKIGKVFSFRANLLTDGLIDPRTPATWRQSIDKAGSGIIGDVSAHAIDLARWFCGEVDSVTAINNCFINKRTHPKNESKTIKIDTDDISTAILEFKTGTIAHIISSGLCLGRKFSFCIEVSGEFGNIYWDFDQFNYLSVCLKERKSSKANGFEKIKVTEVNHPYYQHWYDFCVTLGINYSSTFVNTAYKVVDSIINGTELSPMIATFYDGYKVSLICDAIIKSSKSSKKIKIK